MLPEMEKRTTGVRAWLAVSYPLPGAPQIPLPCFDTSRPRSDLAILSWRGHCWLLSLSNKSMVQVWWQTSTPVAPGTRKPIRLCLECRWRAWAASTPGSASRFFPLNAQVLPVVVPVLATWVICSTTYRFTSMSSTD